MDFWRNRSLLSKLCLGMIVLVAACLAPELMLLLDLGGIEFVISCLAIYYKPVIEWVRDKIQTVNNIVIITLTHLRICVLSRPASFSIHVTYCCLLVLLTGAVYMPFGAFIPALLVSDAAHLTFI
ncbi:hypothetical protein [Pleionea mediterranea]|uniref:Uncharacterized protein n=1 Tax=Pleionea mediterranea TaxID=523701 RepID=A0A316FYX4_9GAMM|nr:hypothetical protein [Pleionea mediterranea]PWK52896.1 hypothetical protein C8D97_104114 [Pleionea mediterranea]